MYFERYEQHPGMDKLWDDLTLEEKKCRFIGAISTPVLKFIKICGKKNYFRFKYYPYAEDNIERKKNEIIELYNNSILTSDVKGKKQLIIGFHQIFNYEINASPYWDDLPLRYKKDRIWRATQIDYFGFWIVCGKDRQKYYQKFKVTPDNVNEIRDQLYNEYVEALETKDCKFKSDKKFLFKHILYDTIPARFVKEFYEKDKE